MLHLLIFCALIGDNKPAADRSLEFRIECDLGSPVLMADQIANPIAKSLEGIAGVTRIRTLSQSAGCVVRLDIKSDVDLGVVKNEAAKRLEQTMRGLPKEFASAKV